MEKTYKDDFLLNEVETLKNLEKGNLEMKNTVTEMKSTLDAVPSSQRRLTSETRD